MKRLVITTKLRPSPYDSQFSAIFIHQGDKSEHQGATLILLAPVSDSQRVTSFNHECLTIRPKSQTGLITRNFHPPFRQVNITPIYLLIHSLHKLGYSHLDLSLQFSCENVSADSLISIRRFDSGATLCPNSGYSPQGRLLRERRDSDFSCNYYRTSCSERQPAFRTLQPFQSLGWFKLFYKGIPLQSSHSPFAR